MTDTAPDGFDAWHPGLTSDIPPELLPRATLYDPANSTVSYHEAKEAALFCGLKPQDMVAFTPRRLVIHEILIRVTADLWVPDGPNYEDLGLSLRGMAERILTGYAEPKMAGLERDFAALRDEVMARLGDLFDRAILDRIPAAPPAEPGLFARLLGKKPPVVAATLPELDALSDWSAAIAAGGSSFDLACLEALNTIVGGIVGQRGRLVGDRDMILGLAANRVCNTIGNQRISVWLTPILREAAAAEGYRFLPYQAEPVVLNVKGASAAGKSTLRPLQRKLVERLGLPWEDFALVSPDYWRKFMLDYDSLGEHYKYAAMLTGQELEIIDKKLDLYMEAKALRSEMPHLLIDRFRFDSFESVSKHQGDGRLLSRFGHTVFMFFVITPPAETVERAWRRGIQTGRYKAVDDLLYHNIEAYTGMPNLFFTWVKKERQKVHFEFLDNSIPFGELPRTAAFGWNDRLTILDMDCMRRLKRYQSVNIHAQNPGEVLTGVGEEGGDILADCVANISEVTFLDPDTLRVVGHTQNGVCDYEAEGFFSRASLGPVCDGHDAARRDTPPDFDADHERRYTVGAWGAVAPPAQS